METTTMKPYRLPRYRIAAGVCVLVLAGVLPAAAQFPPAPGQASSAQANPGGVFPPPPGAQQSSAFPPPPGQSQTAAQQQIFPPPPAPGQAAAPGGFSAPAQGGFGGGGAPPGGGFGGGAGPSEAQKVCMTFPALREDVEKGAAGIKVASARKASREEVCPLFKSFAIKEARMIKFLETNQKLCGVPLQIIPQVKANHAKTIQIRNNVCSTGPSGPGPGPTLSDALGGPIIADDTTSKQPGRGTFDTLTGNALQR
ncbi:MAG: hypothetical protein EXQ83_04830 [Xanthobacteraceae bacterium]|nr:hypothetical protein [Xanthobacteraceae bacterium]